jgi:hypothetical protein
MNDSTLTDTARHEYRIRGARAIPVLLSLVIIALLLLGFFMQGAGVATLVVLGVLAPIFGFLLWYFLRSRLILEGTRLTVIGVFETRVLDQSEIDGIRTFPARYGSYRALCLKRGGRPVKYTEYSIDSAFREWLAHIPNLDERDRKDALAKISEDQDLGATPEERLQALPRAKRLFIAACVIAVAAAVGYNLAPSQWRPWCFAVLAITVLYACFLLYRSPVLYAMGKRRADPRVDVSVLLLIAGFGLVIRGAGLNYVSTTSLLQDGAVAAGILLVVLFRPASKSGQPGRALFLLCILALLCGWGLVTGADTVADPLRLQSYGVTVTGKHISRGSRSTTYYLQLQPWGPYSRENSMTVSSSRYNHTSEGDTVCIALHTGYLHAAWYEPVDCPASPTDAPMQ